MKVEHGAPGRSMITIERGDEFRILDEKGMYFGMVRFLSFTDQPTIYIPGDYKIQPFEKEKQP